MAYNLRLKRCAHNRKMHLILHGTATWAAIHQHRQQLQIVDTRHEVTRGRIRDGTSQRLGRGMLDPKITVSLHYRLGLLPACLLTTRTTTATSIHTYICDDGAVKWTSDDHTRVRTPGTTNRRLRIWINHLKMLRHILSQRSLAISQLLAATSVPLLGTL